MKVYSILAWLILGTGLAGCGQNIEPPPTPSIPRMPAPQFELPDMEGKQVSSDSLLGKIVVLNFWASWSPGCVREIPEWVALQSEYGKKGVLFIGINVDSEGVAVAKPYVEKKGINYPVLMGTTDLGTDFGGLDAIPTTFIIDRDWNLVNRYTGLAPAESIRSEIHALLLLDRQRAQGGQSASSYAPPQASGAEEGPSPYAPKVEEKKEPESVPPTVPQPDSTPAEPGDSGSGVH